MPDKIFIMSGTLDPLMDDSIYFAKRLLKVGKPVTLKLYDGFPHGFINLGAVPSLGKEMWGAVKQVSLWMNQILYGTNHSNLSHQTV